MTIKTQNGLTSFLVVEMYVKPWIVEDSRKSFNPSMLEENCLINYLVGRVTHPKPRYCLKPWNVMTNYVKVNANIQYILHCNVKRVHVRSPLPKVNIKVRTTKCLSPRVKLNTIKDFQVYYYPICQCAKILLIHHLIKWILKI